MKRWMEQAQRVPGQISTPACRSPACVWTDAWSPRAAPPSAFVLLNTPRLTRPRRTITSPTNQYPVHLPQFQNLRLGRSPRPRFRPGPSSVVYICLLSTSSIPVGSRRTPERLLCVKLGGWRPSSRAIPTVYLRRRRHLSVEIAMNLELGRSRRLRSPRRSL